MIRQIMLCDADSDYVSRVANYVREEEFLRSKVTVVPFCSIDALLVEAAQTVPSLIVANIEFQNVLSRSAVEGIPVKWIGEHESSTGKNEIKVDSKYKPLPSLIRSWLDALRPLHYSEDGGRSSAVVALWSVSGGVGKTTVGGWLAKQLISRGSNVFLVSFEPDPVIQLEHEHTVYHDLGGWIFDFKQKKKAGHILTPGINSTPALHLFHPDTSYREYALMGKEEVTAVIGMAAGLPELKYVIVEAGTGWNPKSELVLMSSDLIVFITTPHPYCIAKAEKWFSDWPGWQEGEPLREKTIFVTNKSLDDAAAKRWGGSEFSLPYVPEWKQNSTYRDPSFQRHMTYVSEELWERCISRS